MADIFISYARQDESTAQHLRDGHMYETGRGAPLDLNYALQL